MGGKGENQLGEGGEPGKDGVKEGSRGVKHGCRGKGKNRYETENMLLNI